MAISNSDDYVFLLDIQKRSKSTFHQSKIQSVYTVYMYSEPEACDIGSTA